MFKKCMIAWAVILGLGALALSRHDSTPTVKPVAATPAKSIQQKLNPAEDQPAQGCSVAVFGSKGCKEWQRLHENIEAIRPCAEMRNRGMDVQADRCFKETQEFLRQQKSPGD
jgi:hypothetical protein